jgi:catalase
VLEPDEKERQFSNITATWAEVPEVICERQLAEFKKVHPDYEAGVRRAWEKMKVEGGYKPNAAPVSERSPHLAAQAAE